MPKKVVVIVESPAKAKTIEKMLPKGHKVVASYGHVRDLPKSPLSIDLDTFEGKYAPLDQKKDKINNLKVAVKGADEVYLCPDPDREGEAIAWHLFELLKLDPKTTQRVTFNEITKNAITEAFQAPREINMDLVNSQQARRFMDRIVGYKLSPLLWERVLMGLSAGRVQSVAVRILTEREREVLAFVADEYWTVSAEFDSSLKEGQKFPAELKLLDGKTVVRSAGDVEANKGGNDKFVLLGSAAANEASEKLSGQEYVVSAYDTKESKRKPYPPFATSQLQQAAATVLGFDTKRTMRVAQSLYEGVQVGAETKGLITYMRTDSFSVSNDAANAAESFIKASYGDKYYPESRNIYASRKGSQEAHECIRPTTVELSPENVKSSLSDEQLKLYRLIWERFVASQMAHAIYDSTSCELTSQGLPKGVFSASGRVVKFDGWTKVMSDKDGGAILPVMKVGDDVFAPSVVPEQHFTQPPPRYNEASLVKKLEEEGIGRPSTYASIVELIQARGYAAKVGTGGRAPLKATDVGMAVTDELVCAFPSIMDTGYTREMEEELDKIAEGDLEYLVAMKRFYKEFDKNLKAASKKGGATKAGVKTEFECPKCKDPLYKRLSKYGYYYACQKEECKHTMTIGDDGKPKEKEPPKPVGIKCDLCGADMVKSVGRFGPYLACSNYAKDKSCTFTMAFDKKGLPKRKFSPEKTEIQCEKCKRNHMVVRVASRKKGLNAFLSCSGFPKCRGTAELPEKLDEVGKKAVERFAELRKKDRIDAAEMGIAIESPHELVQAEREPKSTKKKGRKAKKETVDDILQSKQGE